MNSPRSVQSKATRIIRLGWACATASMERRAMASNASWTANSLVHRNRLIRLTFSWRVRGRSASVRPIRLNHGPPAAMNALTIITSVRVGCP